MFGELSSLMNMDWSDPRGIFGSKAPLLTLMYNEGGTGIFVDYNRRVFVFSYGEVMSMEISRDMWPAFVALAHVTSVGEIEKAHLCDNEALVTHQLQVSRLPEWFTARVALLRFCARLEFIPTLQGRRLTEHTLSLHLTQDEQLQLNQYRLINENRKK
jgi:hypothetical protein